MIEQHQTIFGYPNGNCFSTCVACLLDMPVEDVPNFVGDNEDWYHALEDWLVPQGLVPLCIPVEDRLSKYDEVTNALSIATGPSPRGDWYHSVLWKKGKLHWDPHPDGDGLDGDVAYYILILPMNPVGEDDE